VRRIGKQYRKSVESVLKKKKKDLQKKEVVSLE